MAYSTWEIGDPLTTIDRLYWIDDGPFLGLQQCTLKLDNWQSMKFPIRKSSTFCTARCEQLVDRLLLFLDCSPDMVSRWFNNSGSQWFMPVPRSNTTLIWCILAFGQMKYTSHMSSLGHSTSAEVDVQHIGALQAWPVCEPAHNQHHFCHGLSVGHYLTTVSLWYST